MGSQRICDFHDCHESAKFAVPLSTGKDVGRYCEVHLAGVLRDGIYVDTWVPVFDASATDAQVLEASD